MRPACTGSWAVDPAAFAGANYVVGHPARDGLVAVEPLAHLRPSHPTHAHHRHERPRGRRSDMAEPCLEPVCSRRDWCAPRVAGFPDFPSSARSHERFRELFEFSSRTPPPWEGGIKPGSFRSPATDPGDLCPVIGSVLR